MWRPKEDWEKKRDYWLNTVGGKFADSGEAMEASVIYEAGADAILKGLQELDWKITTIGPERSVPDRTQIRFLFEDEYQALLKEV